MRISDVSFPRGTRLAWITVLLLGVLAGATPWLASLRPVPSELRADREIRVSNPADAGPGTLREAIFAADRAGGRARVVLDVAKIVLQTPLPPLINPDGVVINAVAPGCEIDAGGLLEGPVLDLASPDSVVSGVRIRGAAGQGIMVRGEGAHLRRVSVRDSNIGVYLAEGGDGLRLEEAEFEANTVGVHLSSGVTLASLRDNRFRRHKQAAVWGVNAQPLPAGRPVGVELLGNRFETDSMGVVLINFTGRVERNHFSGEQKAAIYLTGPGSVVRGNRISAGAGFGIYADATQGIPIERNEVDHNFAGGVLIRSARSTTVRSNRLYSNGYGIVVVFGPAVNLNSVTGNLLLQQHEDGLYVVGGSPIVRANQVRGSGGVGLRILDFIWGEQPRVVASPLLDGNVLTGNASDVPARGEYRIEDLRGREGREK